MVLISMSDNKDTKYKRNITILSFALGLCLFALLIALYFLLTSSSAPASTELPWKQLFIDLVPNLLASVLGFLIALSIFKRINESYKEQEHEELAEKIKNKLPASVIVQSAPDLSHMEKLLEDTVGKWKTWNPEGVCSMDHIGCPKVLKNIYSKYNLTATDNPEWFKRINLLLLGRLNAFNKQIVEVEYGKWQFVPEDGDLLTDADLTYNIISENILSFESDIVIKAVTILPYIKWWLTPVGLKYLERQRQFKVSRTFLFPDDVFPILYPELFNGKGDIKENKKRFEDKNDFLLDERLIRIILYIHYCLGINVNLLSPAILREQTKTVNSARIVNKWQFHDTAIFQKITKGNSENICAIQIKTLPDIFSEYLVADEGTVDFENNIIQKNILDEYNTIVPYAINFNNYIESAKFKPNDELAGIARVLKYDLEKRKFNEDYRLDSLRVPIHNFIKYGEVNNGLN